MKNVKEAGPKIVEPYLREKMEEVKIPQVSSMGDEITRPVNIRNVSGLILPKVVRLEEQLDKKQNLLTRLLRTSSLYNSAFSATKITCAKPSDEI